ncbi:unnamed protein product [Lymnaea stagnalis]|uniref:Uncharacterized protein n=1 Tax=Lymnaea stagnalis TaxID=6523 RepID=A0AAV2H7G8_LYMST
MAGHNGGFVPIGDAFSRELAYTNYGDISEERNQQSHPEPPPYSRNDTQRYQENSRTYDGWEAFDATDKVSSTATAAANGGTGYSGHDNLYGTEVVDQNQGPHRREQELYEIGALRAYHKALKEDKERSTRVTDDRPGGTPVGRSMNGDESYGLGQRPSRAHVYGQTRSTEPEDSDDELLPHDDGMAETPAYGHYDPADNYPKHHSQQDRSTAYQNRQPYPTRSTYGYDQQLANPQVSPLRYPGQPYPAWQDGSYHPNAFNPDNRQDVYNQSVSAATKIPDYSTLSIVVLIFFSWPLGLIAFCRARSAKAAKMQGNFTLAMEHAQSSKKWNIWGVVVGLLCHALVGLVIYLRMKRF